MPIPRPTSPARYDVLIAGARCAGASTALMLARAGLRVLVVDPLPRGRDTLSTHALMRGAVLQLHRWGLLDRVRAAGTPAITATTFDYGDEVVTIPLKSKDGVDALFAPRRTVLDPILVDAAEEAGAEFRHGWALAELIRDGERRVRGARLRGPGQASTLVEADWVVGADGLRSPTARLVGAATLRSARHTTASIYGYWTGLPDHEYRWCFRPGMGAGIIPTNDGRACVFVSVSPRQLEAVGARGLRRLVDRQMRRVDPELATRLARGPDAVPLRAFAGHPGHLRQVHGPGWALVGDAGYFRDPLTAHGISDALRDAELLAEALAVGSEEALADYQRQRDSVAVGLMDVTDRIAALDWSMAEVKELHHRLNLQMNAGLELIRARPAPVCADRAGSGPSAPSLPACRRRGGCTAA